MNQLGTPRLPGRAVAPGRVGREHAAGRVRPEDDGPDRGFAQGGGLGRAVVRLARASYHNPKEPSPPSRSRGCAEEVVVDGAWRHGGAGHRRTDLVLPTATTTATAIHFSPMGLAAHGRLWAEKVGPWPGEVAGPATAVTSQGERSQAAAALTALAVKSHELNARACCADVVGNRRRDAKAVVAASRIARQVGVAVGGPAGGGVVAAIEPRAPRGTARRVRPLGVMRSALAGSAAGRSTSLGA